MLGTCWVHAWYMLGTCRVHAGYMPGTCWVHAGYMNGNSCKKCNSSKRDDCHWFFPKWKQPPPKSGFPIFYQFHLEGKMMKRAMISQPLAGKTEEEITATRGKAVKALEGMGYEVIPTERGTSWYSPEEMKKRGVIHIPLCYLAKSLDQMCTVDAVYFCKGWAQARGCQIEHEVALKYGLEILNDGLTRTKLLRRREE